MKIQVSEDQILQAGQGFLKPIQMFAQTFDSVHSPERATPTSLVFISSQEFLNLALTNKASGMIILEKSFEAIKEQIPSSVSVWTTPHIQMAMSKILDLFNRKVAAHPSGIHPTAVIHADAKVAPTASVGPYAVIQQFAVVGEHAKIGSHTVIEAYAEVGSHSYLNPHVVVGAFCRVGSSCIIAPHVTIGSDGFGFVPDGKTNHKIPQIGNVVIEDNCEIGGNCAIDRAALEQTIIRKGTKLDNLCHIAHNVDIGENGLLAGAFKVAGSTKIGRNLMTSGNIDVNGHIEICDNVILTARTGVTSSITEPGMYGGFPEVPHKDNIRNMVTISQLHKIRKHVQKILKHLGLED